MVTSRDVARVAGVSQATVSRVLNGNDRVNPQARDAVLAALESTGYVPNASAKTMRTKSSGAIGVVTSEIQNPFLPYLVDALTRAASEQGTTLVVWNDGDPDVPTATGGAASGVVDGLLFTAATTETTGIEGLIRRGFPVMLCNRAGDEHRADVVMSDHYGSGVDSARYLVGHGHERIAAIFGPQRTYASPARQAGFRAALEEAGVELRAGLATEGLTSYESGFAAAERLIATGEAVDAVFCSSDIIAYGAIDAFRKHGRRVPEDLWVSAVDGLPMSAWSAFDLTTLSQQVDRIASEAVAGLLRRIGGEPSEPERVLVPTVLQPRGSTEGRAAPA